jgi:hypothetical protein
MCGKAAPFRKALLEPYGGYASNARKEKQFTSDIMVEFVAKESVMRTMAAILGEPKTAIAAAPAESRVLLRNVSWKTYESLLDDLADCSAPRLTYKRGLLEIMSPQAKHESIKEIISLLIGMVVCEEFE